MLREICLHKARLCVDMVNNPLMVNKHKQVTRGREGWHFNYYFRWQNQSPVSFRDILLDIDGAYVYIFGIGGEHKQP